MTDELTDAALDAIDAWCADALEKYGLPERRIPIWAQTVCEYEDALPTHSIRSSVVALVAALRSERTQTRALRAAANEVSDAWNEYIENDAPMDEVVDAIEMLRAALAAKEGTNG